MPIQITRIGNRPLIAPHMDTRMGDNICGPSLVRMPDWAAGRLGKYHLYFADHKGSYIRLAYSDALTGSWRVHRPGAMDVTNSLFEPVDPPEPPVAERPYWAANLKGGYLYAHVASPDVHVDEAKRCFWMYYHGLLANGDQQTRVAVSRDGLNFEPYGPLLGPPYFRVFQHASHHYALSFGGALLRATDWQGPFEFGPQLLTGSVRHCEVHCLNDVLHVFYTRIGDQPESILHCTIPLAGDWHTWQASPATIILQPQLEWEGADLDIKPSILGGLDKRKQELRDPCVFEDDDGQTYLLYCGAGEGAIGIAQLCL